MNTHRPTNNRPDFFEVFDYPPRVSDIIIWSGFSPKTIEIIIQYAKERAYKVKPEDVSIGQLFYCPHSDDLYYTVMTPEIFTPNPMVVYAFCINDGSANKLSPNYLSDACLFVETAHLTYVEGEEPDSK